MFQRGQAVTEEKDVLIEAGGPVVHSAIRIERRGAPGNQDSKIEQLGTKTIEGVLAQGTRTTTTLPAGAIGNDRPIEMVWERWQSPELQLTVFSKRVDPRFGETVMRLINIQRAEQPKSLFEVPPDYKVVEGPVQFMMRKTQE
jgi:hypothetical protein